MDSAYTLRYPQWDVSAFTEEQNKETRRCYSTYRTDEKTMGKKIPSIKRIKSWIPFINEECDYKGDGNFGVD